MVFPVLELMLMPPLTLEAWPLAVLPWPPLTLEKSHQLAVLLTAPNSHWRSWATGRVASEPPLTLAAFSHLALVVLAPAHAGGDRPLAVLPPAPTHAGEVNHWPYWPCPR